MKHRCLTFTLAVGSLFIGTSCDSYLDINPKQVLDQNILNKPSDVEGFVTAAYARMCEIGSFDSPYMYWWSGSMRADDSYKGGGGVADAIGLWGHMSMFTYVNPNTGGLDGTWYNSYQVIQRCNTAIQKIVQFSEEELPRKNSFLGEMLFIRSFTLYRLKKLWKYVPYIDENVIGMSDAFEAVPNREKGQANDLYLWQRILDDFKKAESLLPLEQEDKGRVSKNAATAMIARTMLNMAYEQNDQHKVVNINKELLAEALIYCDRIIEQEQTGKVGLENDFGNNFLVQYDNATKESIWEMQFSMDNNFHTAGRFNRAEGLNHPWMWPETEPGKFVFKCCDFNHASYTMANAFKTDVNGLPRFNDYNDDDYGQYIKNPDGSYNLEVVNSGAKEYFDKYTWDPRFSHTIVAPGQPWKYDPELIFHSSASRDPITYSFLKPIKELPHPNCDCIAYDGWQFNSMNKKMIRYDDVLLWKAEILIQLDREMEALPFINKVRNRAANSLIRLTQSDGTYTLNYHAATYQPGVNCTWTKDYAWQALVWENRLEFACEGHRFFDLQRWGMLEEVLNDYYAIEKTRFDWFNDAHFTAGRDEYFPISQPQMNYSKGNYTQNPGY